jgi:hypothetical protein
MDDYRVALTSYPCADNNISRTYFEEVTKIVTGCDMLIDDYNVMAS